MRLLVCGSRAYGFEPMLRRTLDALHAESPVHTVIEGGARGADALGARWALDQGIEVETYPADWGRHGKRAGYLRNVEMLEQGKPDFVLAFVIRLNGDTADQALAASRGTAMMVQLAKDAGVRGRLIAGG